MAYPPVERFNTIAGLQAQRKQFATLRKALKLKAQKGACDLALLDACVRSLILSSWQRAAVWGPGRGLKAGESTPMMIRKWVDDCLVTLRLADFIHSDRQASPHKIWRLTAPSDHNQL